MIPSLIAMIPPTLYYSRVGLELGKLVFRGQKMTPPYVHSRSSFLNIDYSNLYLF